MSSKPWNMENITYFPSDFLINIRSLLSFLNSLIVDFFFSFYLELPCFLWCPQFWYVPSVNIVLLILLSIFDTLLIY